MAPLQRYAGADRRRYDPPTEDEQLEPVPTISEDTLRVHALERELKHERARNRRTARAIIALCRPIAFDDADGK